MTVHYGGDATTPANTICMAPVAHFDSVGLPKQPMIAMAHNLLNLLLQK